MSAPSLSSDDSIAQTPATRPDYRKVRVVVKRSGATKSWCYPVFKLCEKSGHLRHRVRTAPVNAAGELLVVIRDQDPIIFELFLDFVMLGRFMSLEDRKGWTTCLREAALSPDLHLVDDAYFVTYPLALFLEAPELMTYLNQQIDGLIGTRP